MYAQLHAHNGHLAEPLQSLLDFPKVELSFQFQLRTRSHSGSQRARISPGGPWQAAGDRQDPGTGIPDIY